jgi:uncharacterized protein
LAGLPLGSGDALTCRKPQNVQELRVSKYARLFCDPADFSSHLLVSLALAPPRIFRVSSSVADALRTSALDRLDFKTITLLHESRVLVPRDANELVDVIAENRRVTQESKILQRIIMPTANCVHGCNLPQYGAYCGQQHTDVGLSGAQISRELHEIEVQLQSGRYEVLDLGFFGGEPLLRFQAICSILGAARALCEQYFVSLRARMTTSGFLLTLAKAETLVNSGLAEFEVTLDGLAPTHDVRRCTKAGGPTFDKTYDNLLSIAHSKTLTQLLGTVRMNIDSRNQNDVIPLLDTLISDGIVPRFNFYVSPVRNVGVMRAGSTFLDRRKLAEIELRVLRRAMSLGVVVDPVPGREYTICPAVNPNAKVVDPFGAAHRCTETPLVHLQHELPQGFGRDDDWQGGWESVLSRNAVPCSACTLFPVCGGACPKDWLQGNPPCPIYKDNMHERVVLAAYSARRDIFAIES